MYVFLLFSDNPPICCWKFSTILFLVSFSLLPTLPTSHPYHLWSGIDVEEAMLPFLHFSSRACLTRSRFFVSPPPSSSSMKGYYLA